MMTPNNPTPDLAELDRLHAAAVKQTWAVEIEEYGNSGSVTVHGLERLLHDTEWADPEDFEIDQAKAHWIAEISNAYPALAARIRELEGENDFMRLRLAESDKDCVYCQLPKSETARCSSGFPGCARADDLFHCDELTRRDERMKREGAAQGIEQAREMMSMAESGEEADEMMRKAAKRLREEK